MRRVGLINTANVADEIAQEFKPLQSERGGEQGDSGDVAAWTAEALHHPTLHGIAAHKDDGNTRCRRFSCSMHNAASRRDEWRNASARYARDVNLKKRQRSRQASM
jgi:hypothetical protein